MSKGDWSGYYTPGLIVLSILSALLAAALVYNASGLQSGYEHRAESGAIYYRHAADEAVKRRCVPLPDAEEAKCRREERETAREGQRKEHDLEAQRVTAVWTRYMGYAAIVGMTIGVFGLGLIFVTFRETRRAAVAARSTHDAFVSVERARLIFRRPHVNFEELGKGLKVTLRVENVGKSSAVVKAVRWVPSKSPRFPKAGFRQVRHEYGVLSGQCGEVFDTYSAVDWHAEPYVVGYVEYSSAFSDGHRSYFCYRLKEGVADAYGPAQHGIVSLKSKATPKDT